MLEVFSRLGLKIESALRNINSNDKGWVDIDEFFGVKYANSKNASELKNYLASEFGSDYKKYFYQDGKDNLTKDFEKKLFKLDRIRNPKHFGNNMVDCRVWTLFTPDKKSIYLLQFDEPKTPPTKMILAHPQDISDL